MAKSEASTKMKVKGLSNAKESGVQPLDLSSPNYFLPFFVYVTIPKLTFRASPVITSVELPKGQIYKLWVEFPEGCKGLAGVQVWRGVRQIFPLPADVWLRSDNSVLAFGFTEEFITHPFSVDVRGYNEDDTYNHTIWIGLEMKGLYGGASPRLQEFVDYIGGR